MKVCLKTFYGEKERQKTGVSDTEGSQATRETRETTEDGKLRPWRKGFEKHLRQYTATAVDEYTRGHLSEAFDQFGANLSARYSEVDELEKTYLFAKSHGQTEIADEILSLCQETRTAASVSPLRDVDPLGLIVLTRRQNSSQRCPKCLHLVPHRPPPTSRLPSPPKHHCSSDQN